MDTVYSYSRSKLLIAFHISKLSPRVEAISNLFEEFIFKSAN